MTILEVSIAIAFIVFGLWFDISRHKDNHNVGLKDATHWTIFWVAYSMVFAVVVWALRGSEAAELYVTGYVLEKALALDNLFVFVAIFSSFGLSGPDKSAIRHKILYYGIIGAIGLRVIFIGLGTWLANLSPLVLVAFGIIILYTAWLMWTANDEEEEIDYTEHWATKIGTRFWQVDPSVESGNFFTVSSYAKHIKYITPLFLCLLVIEISDVVFAFDSVPTIIAVVQDKYLVFTASIFAVMGLRSMFFLLDALKDIMCHLEDAIIIVLVGIGIKVIGDGLGLFHISTGYSLAFVMFMISTGIVASLIWPEEADAA